MHAKHYLTGCRPLAWSFASNHRTRNELRALFQKSSILHRFSHLSRGNGTPAGQSAKNTLKGIDNDNHTKAAQLKTKDALLSERVVSDKEQRRADWAIIKDMAKYLWPKDDLGTRSRVGLSLALLVGSKVCFMFRVIVFETKSKRC